MKLKRHSLLIILLIFGSFTQITLGQSSATKAKQLLNKVTNKIKTYQTLKIDFKYNLSNYNENINQESRGNIALQNNLYHLNFMGVNKIFDGTKIYTIIPEDEEINIVSFDKDDDTQLTPSNLFTFFQKGFNYKMDILQNLNGRKIQYVKLIPKDSNDQRKQVLVGIDTMTNHIYNIIETGKNSTVTTLTVTSLKTNIKLSENHFKFVPSKYEDYYINNLD